MARAALRSARATRVTTSSREVRQGHNSSGRTQIAGGATLRRQPFPSFNYDTSKGVWAQDGVATLIGTGTNAAYVKDVSISRS